MTLGATSILSHSDTDWAAVAMGSSKIELGRIQLKNKVIGANTCLLSSLWYLRTPLRIVLN